MRTPTSAHLLGRPPAPPTAWPHGCLASWPPGHTQRPPPWGEAPFLPPLALLFHLCGQEGQVLCRGRQGAALWEPPSGASVPAECLLDAQLWNTEPRLGELPNGSTGGR